MYLSRLGFDRTREGKEGAPTLGRAEDFPTIFSGITPMPVNPVSLTLVQSRHRQFLSRCF